MQVLVLVGWQGGGARRRAPGAGLFRGRVGVGRGKARVGAAHEGGRGALRRMPAAVSGRKHELPAVALGALRSGGGAGWPAARHGRSAWRARARSKGLGGRGCCH
jgi:hypothetical protein